MQLVPAEHPQLMDFQPPAIHSGYCWKDLLVNSSVLGLLGGFHQFHHKQNLLIIDYHLETQTNRFVVKWMEMVISNHFLCKGLKSSN